MSCAHRLLNRGAAALRRPAATCLARAAWRPAAAPALARGLATLEAHGLKMDRSAQYNPEWKPEGFEGGVDTNALPWLELPQLPGCSFKPLRASPETGAFAALIKVPKGTVMPTMLHLGAADTFVLTGKLTFQEGPMKGSIGPGVWAYTPAGAKIRGLVAEEDTEYLATFYAPAAALGPDGKITGFLTGPDAKAAAEKAGLSLLPNTLAEALQRREKPAYSGPADTLQMIKDNSGLMLSKLEAPGTELTNPHYVDTNKLPWIINPEAPEIALKVMRISAETGTVSLIVRQNGQAPPHYHLGPADFFITSGHIGYRAGPPEGYGPGTYMYEPAGARHEATQRVTDEDLIYTANVWGPIQFDSGVGTPVLMVMSWMQYLEAAKAFNSPLIASTFPDDAATLLAVAPTGE